MPIAGVHLPKCYVVEYKRENIPENRYKSMYSHQKFLTWVGRPLGKILIYQNLQTERTKNPS